jgi:hypothetical protein
MMDISNLTFVYNEPDRLKQAVAQVNAHFGEGTITPKAGGGYLLWLEDTQAVLALDSLREHYRMIVIPGSV